MTSLPAFLIVSRGGSTQNTRPAPLHTRTSLFGGNEIGDRARDLANVRPIPFFAIRSVAPAKTRAANFSPSHVCSVGEEIVRVWTQSDLKQTNAVARDIIAEARAAAIALVDREHRITLSRMLAYERVASQVGTSASWLRKFVNGYPDATKPDLVVGFNILTHHARLIAPRNGTGRSGSS